ncbi:MAG: hypothetical protein CMO26_14910 [Thiotrichales bacterium]|nr:hypothetical protein [Thiotrichales bacterium]
MTVQSLGYLVLDTAHCEQWSAFGEDILGMDVNTIDRGGVGLRMDEHVWRIALQPSTRDDVAVIGWQVADDAALAIAADTLAACGIKAERHEADEHCALRAVATLLAFEDPSGQAVEVFHTRTCNHAPRRDAREHGFVTGELGLGHVFNIVNNFQATCDLYERLGFRLSDHMAERKIRFYRCNPRQHSLALADASANLGMSPGFGHFMVEVDDMDTVGRARDRCAELSVPVEYELGRHTNDQMFSFYPRTPSGFAAEIGWGGLRVDEATWQVTEMLQDSVWGHHKLSTDAS